MLRSEPDNLSLSYILLGELTKPRNEALRKEAVSRERLAKLKGQPMVTSGTKRSTIWDIDGRWCEQNSTSHEPWYLKRLVVSEASL